MAQVQDLIIKAAHRSLEWQRSDGSYPPGHNGPWGNVDTPVRTTAHWLITLLAGHRWSGAPELRQAARRAADFLAHPDRRPGNHSFQCIVDPHPAMASNGLIGQAWVLEGLLAAGAELDPIYFQPLQEVARKHRSEDSLGLWSTLGLHGETFPVHGTLNHQVWFSVQVFLLARAVQDQELEQRARRHFAVLPRLVWDRGRYLDMLVDPAWLYQGKRGSWWKETLARWRNPLEELRERARVREQSLGYLSFTLYALARLFEVEPNLPLWNEPSFRDLLGRSILFADRKLFGLKPEQNRYAFSYNPTGIEMAYVKQSLGSFAPGLRTPQEWLEEQFRRHYDAPGGQMVRSTPDPNILAARLYELALVKDQDFSLD